MAAINYKNLGARLLQLREGMSVSQETLAQSLGVTRQAIGQIEKGDRKIDSLELAKLAEFFSLSTDEFLKADLAEKSSRSRVKRTEGISFEPSKLENLILYVLEKCGGKPNIGETVLYKILYFIDFDAYESIGLPVTGMPYMRLQFGPVPKKKEYDSVIVKMQEEGKLNIFSHQYYNKMQRRYVALSEPDVTIFNAAEIGIIHKVINRLSDMSAREITEYVHGDVPWKVTPEGEVIEYRNVFERETPYSSQDYGTLFQQASAQDILESLGPISEEEAEYYRNL